MSNQLKNLLAGVLAASTLMGCNLGVSREDADTPEGYYFEGYIYNGVTNERIEDLDITVTQRGVDVGADVDGDGHFLVGPIKPDHDYVVTIEADGYREFFAAETGPFNLPSSDDNQQTWFYEAFLFPEDIVSPEVTLDFYTPDGASARPNGTLRLTPQVGSALSAIHLDATTTVASVGGQVWSNDADRRQRTATFDVEDGVVTVEEGGLVYGVTYRGTIYGSDGYAYEEFFYTSGLEGSRTVSLGRLDPQDLALTHNSLEISNTNGDAEIVLTFNQPVELSDVIPEAQLAEIIDDAFTIDSPDYDSDGDVNVLISNIGDDPADSDRGTRLRVDGNTLTLTWARANSNFDNRDGDDPIESVTYNALDQVNLRIAGGRVDQEMNLATLLGTDFLTVYVDGVSAADPVPPPPPLALTSTALAGTTASDSGVVTASYTFNRPIQFYEGVYFFAEQAEFIDDGFSFVSPNTDADGFTNSPVFTDINGISDQGTLLSISGSTVTISWDKTLGTVDPDDLITSVTFANLATVYIEPVTSMGGEQATLGSFVGTFQAIALPAP